VPYSQVDVDRALPNVKDPVVEQSSSAGATVFGFKRVCRMSGRK
jgi:hypothetical protein